MLHEGEEPLISKNGKSGAIFFAGCSLKCVYCQNYEISHSYKGTFLSPSDLAEVFKKLEDAGAENIDLVTPTHFADKILEALKIYKPKVPVVYNTSGFESVKTLKSLKGYVDIYLTDYKYFDDDLAKRLSNVLSYRKNAESALKEMKKQKKTNKFKDNALVSGIIVRHLVLPSHTLDSLKVLDRIRKILGKKAIVSIMSQYTPIDGLKEEDINRKLKPLEYKMVVRHALKLKLFNSLVQDLDSATACLTPDFKSKIFEI